MAYVTVPKDLTKIKSKVILKPKKDAAKGSSSLDDLDFDEDDEETEVVETEQTEQEDDNL